MKNEHPLYIYIIERCAAGYQSIENVDCSVCPPETYKKEYSSKKCFSCGSGMTTDGKSGATSCKGKYIFISNH